MDLDEEPVSVLLQEFPGDAGIVGLCHSDDYAGEIGVVRLDSVPGLHQQVRGAYLGDRPRDQPFPFRGERKDPGVSLFLEWGRHVDGFVVREES